ncbi:MAG: FAD-dependent oxidoreductase, partial [Erythrobacter sp.]
NVRFAVGEGGLLPDFGARVRAKVAAELERQGIEVLHGDARLREGNVGIGQTSLEPVDLIVAALGSAAPDWPRRAGLACDDDGFIAVDRYQRSVSHPHVFAVGDVAARVDRELPHSGVHAVFAGPILADNLRRAANGDTPRRSYTPRWNHLYLMSAGDGSAIASYGPFAAHGRWVAWLKDRIDMRWIAKYRKLAQGR